MFKKAIYTVSYDSGKNGVVSETKEEQEYQNKLFKGAK